MLGRTIKKIAGTMLCATVLAATTTAQADNTATENTNSAPTLNLARLATILQAASDRKQSGSEVTLKKDARLHGRPTGDVAEGSILPAGTVVRKSKRQVVNASGAWRHIETRDGNDGWLHELDFDPE
jgi:hypothetical protein